MPHTHVVIGTTHASFAVAFKHVKPPKKNTAKKPNAMKAVCDTHPRGDDNYPKRKSMTNFAS